MLSAFRVEQGDKDWLLSEDCERDFIFFRPKIFDVSKRLKILQKRRVSEIRAANEGDGLKMHNLQLCCFLD
jgi:hypothetical protein